MSAPHLDRVPGLTAEQMSDDTRRLLNVTPTSKPLPILTVIAHHPAYLGPFLEWAATLALRGVLSSREQEILALRAAYHCRSEFEWGHHVAYGRAAGLDDADLDRLVAGPDAPGWPEHERALVTAADQLCGPAHDIDDATFAVLQRHYDAAQLVEISFVVGQYAMLSMMANSLGVALEDGYERFPIDGRRAV